jgi:hypothetical protein
MVESPFDELPSAKRFLPVLATDSIPRVCDDRIKISRKLPYCLRDHSFSFVVTAEIGEASGRDRVAIRGVWEFAPRNLTAAKRFLKVTASVSSLGAPASKVRTTGITPQPILHHHFGFVEATKIEKQLQCFPRVHSHRRTKIDYSIQER